MKGESGAEVPEEERGGSCSQLLPFSPVLSFMSTPLLALNLRSLSLDSQAGKAEERRPLSRPGEVLFPQPDTLEGTKG